MPFTSVGTVQFVTTLLSAGEEEEQPLFPSAASPIPSPAGSSLVNYGHQLLGKSNHCEPFARGVEKPIQTPHCLLLPVQTGGGLMLPAFPALLLSWEERGKRRTKMEGGGSVGSNYMCSAEA